MSRAIQFITAAQPQIPLIFLPIEYHSNQLQIGPISKLKGFSIFNKQNGNQASRYKTIKTNSPVRKYITDSYKPLPTRRFDYDNHVAKNSFNQRDGWSAGLGGGEKQSPALSALALLGFLFFLNLIQNSLINNRLLYPSTSTPMNSTVYRIGSNIVYGRNGRVRRRRGLGFNKDISTPESIPTHPNQQLLNLLQDFPPKEQVSVGWRYEQDKSLERLNQQDTKSYSTQGGTIRATSGSLIQKIQKASWECLELLACNLRRSVFGGDPGRGIFMGSNTNQNWTRGMFRALAYGWRTRLQCDKIFTKCIFTNPFRDRT